MRREKTVSEGMERLTFDKVEAIDLVGGQEQVLQQEHLPFLSFGDLGTDTA